MFLDGKVHDPQRIDYMHRVLLELSRAIKDGVPITGYYVWSLIDNFEWADGYKQRFGIVYVDYQIAEARPQGFVRLVQEGHRQQRPQPARARHAAGDAGNAGLTAGAASARPAAPASRSRSPPADRGRG